MRLVTRILSATVLSLAFCFVNANARVDTVRFQSKLLAATAPYNVILPPDYDSATTARYPVLYLLHGYTGHYSDWVSRTFVTDYAAQYRIIIVTPEGNNGWYTNSATVSTDKYESYILNELIPDVEKQYRTIEAKYGRAIAGLSMGGYGAIKFGLKAPGTFALAASMSGAVGVTKFTEAEVGGKDRLQELVKVFGEVGSETRKANDLFDIINALTPERIASLPYFYFDCGTEDVPLIFKYNVDLAKLMKDKKIPHEYRQLPGDHSWAYWDQQIQPILQILSQKLRVPPSPPAKPAAKRPDGA